MHVSMLESVVTGEHDLIEYVALSPSFHETLLAPCDNQCCSGRGASSTRSTFAIAFGSLARFESALRARPLRAS